MSAVDLVDVVMKVLVGRQYRPTTPSRNAVTGDNAPFHKSVLPKGKTVCGSPAFSISKIFGGCLSAAF